MKEKGREIGEKKRERKKGRPQPATGILKFG
jgi:hypothetical protein